MEAAEQKPPEAHSPAPPPVEPVAAAASHPPVAVGERDLTKMPAMSEDDPIVRSLRSIPGYLAAVAIGGPDGPILDRRRGAERAEPALTLALSCLTGSIATLMTSSGDAVCLVDTSRGVAVAGGRGLNLGFVRRAVRDMPARTPTTSWSADAPVIFSAPWRTALWRMVQVIDRTVSPRRLTIEGSNMAPLLVADGRVEVSHRGDLNRLGETLREVAARSKGSLRYSLAPTVEVPATSVSAVEVFAEAALVESTDSSDVTLDEEGWPLAMPRGMTFPALALAIVMGRRLAASGKGAQVAALHGALQHRVALRGERGRVEIDSGWLASQMGANPTGMDSPSTVGDTSRPEAREIAGAVR